MTIIGTFFDAATGITENRPLTENELAVLETNAAYAETQADALAARKAARKALLTKLGITAEEAQLLLGGM